MFYPNSRHIFNIVRNHGSIFDGTQLVTHYFRWSVGDVCRCCCFHNYHAKCRDTGRRDRSPPYRVNAHRLHGKLRSSNCSFLFWQNISVLYTSTTRCRRPFRVRIYNFVFITQNAQDCSCFFNDHFRCGHYAAKLTRLKRAANSITLWFYNTHSLTLRRTIR